jgi:capsular exopolysaccharide synthesis family protein
MMESRMVSTMEDVMDQKRSLGSQERNYSFAFAEAFYGLETNLRLLSSDTPVQVVTITSSLPGEGKSTTSAHLAIAAANMGRRVLVVDVDLRQPSLHDIFGLPNRVGLSDLITQGVEKAPQVIRSLDHNPNLHFLGAGTQPPAPGRLLSSQRMHQLIEACRQRYDLIILDTPPLIGIADAKLVAAQADGLLLVARLRKTPRSEVQRVLADLNNTAQAPILGLVINGVLASSRHGYYSQYYGHYHRPAHNRG